MKFLEKHSQPSWFKAAIIMEEGDYTEDNPLYQQLISNVSIGGVFFGQILTYKTRNAT